MNLRHLVSLAFLCSAALLSGCDGGREAPGRVNFRVANAAPGFAQLGYQRERPQRENPATLVFKGASPFSYETDTYDFFVFERVLAGGRTWTFEQTLRGTNEYTLVLTENAGEVVPVVLEYENPNSSTAQILALHAGGGLPAMDVYLEPPGAGIAGAAPRGSLAERGQTAPRTLTPGDYEIWLTAAGNPTSVLFTSVPIALAAGETAVLVVTPEAGAGTAALSVMLLQASPAVLYDRNATGELRVINGATDAQPRDFVINNEFSPPLFSAIPFATPTAYAPVPVASGQPINVTPPGNPGVLELSTSFTMTPGQRGTLLFGGEAGALSQIVAGDDGRRLVGEAKVRLLNAASQFLALDFLLLEPDADPSQFAPDVQLTTPGVGDYVPRAPGEYDLYLRQSGTSTIVYGPTRVTLASGGIYGVLAVNGADTATANVVLFDDFP
jgi:hypothetical protein